MSLATINVTNVTEEKFLALQDSATKEFKGHFTQATVGFVTSGTLVDHGSTVDYTFDLSKNEIVFDIINIGRVFFKKPSVEQVKEAVVGWVEEVIAQMPKNPVGETVPKEGTVIKVPSTTKASDVPVTPVQNVDSTTPVLGSAQPTTPVPTTPNQNA
jgi:hypothetical protein